MGRLREWWVAGVVVVVFIVGLGIAVWSLAKALGTFEERVRREGLKSVAEDIWYGSDE